MNTITIGDYLEDIIVKTSGIFNMYTYDRENNEISILGDKTYKLTNLEFEIYNSLVNWLNYKSNFSSFDGVRGCYLDKELIDDNIVLVTLHCIDTNHKDLVFYFAVSVGDSFKDKYGYQLEGKSVTNDGIILLNDMSALCVYTI